MSSGLRRALSRPAFAAVEALWTLSLRVCRPVCFDSQAQRRWEPGGRVLVVAPHPDDETLGAGGVIALHRRHGDPVRVVIVTDGSASRAPGTVSAQSMARRRAEEVAAAVRLLGVAELILLDLPEGDWDAPLLCERLAPLLDDVDVVYAPSCVDFHPEHMRVARYLAGMLRPSQKVRVYALGVPLTPFLANLVADIRSVQAVKNDALACFTSQQTALSSLARLARYRRALYGIAHSEVFWEMPAQSYRDIMDYGAWDWKDTPFRGIRPRPFSDLLAFLRGRRARRRLRQLAAANMV